MPFDRSSSEVEMPLRVKDERKDQELEMNQDAFRQFIERSRDAAQGTGFEDKDGIGEQVLNLRLRMTRS